MIAIIDYKSGNIGSVKNALQKLGFNYLITNDAEKILSAKGVIFPGQGRAGMAMDILTEYGLIDLFKKIEVPFLGVCLGMQLLSAYSEEDGTDCLNIVGGKCRIFPWNLKIPHIGWNKVNFQVESDLFKDISTGEYFYFAHSYYLDTCGQTVALTSYEIDFAAAVERRNFYGVQFHPEKSGNVGLKLLDNFCKLCF